MIAVKDQPELGRDSYSKGIINTNYAALQEHRNKRKSLEDISNMHNEINSLKEDMIEIKYLLQLLINNKT